MDHEALLVLDRSHYVAVTYKQLGDTDKGTDYEPEGKESILKVSLLPKGDLYHEVSKGCVGRGRGREAQKEVVIITSSPKERDLEETKMGQMIR